MPRKKQNHGYRTYGDTTLIESKEYSADTRIRGEFSDIYNELCTKLYLLRKTGTPDPNALIRFACVFFLLNRDLRTEIMSRDPGPDHDCCELKASLSKDNLSQLSRYGPKSTILRATASWLREMELLSRSANTNHKRYHESRSFFERWHDPVIPKDEDLIAEKPLKWKQVGWLITPYGRFRRMEATSWGPAEPVPGLTQELLHSVIIQKKLNDMVWHNAGDDDRYQHVPGNTHNNDITTAWYSIMEDHIRVDNLSEFEIRRKQAFANLVSAVRKEQSERAVKETGAATGTPT